jgi:hypothetical protein
MRLTPLLKQEYRLKKTPLVHGLLLQHGKPVAHVAKPVALSSNLVTGSVNEETEGTSASDSVGSRRTSVIGIILIFKMWILRDLEKVRT